MKNVNKSFWIRHPRCHKDRVPDVSVLNLATLHAQNCACCGAKCLSSIDLNDALIFGGSPQWVRGATGS